MNQYLTAKKLNDEKTKVNQELTARGIKKADYKILTEAIALTMQPRSFQDEDLALQEQYEQMKKETRQKKLLEHQLKTNPMNISTFLSNKYTDGAFNVAQIDRYDNSAERLKNGITFEYHVFLPEDPQFNNQRGHNRYVLSEPILDRRTGDTYIYHIPMYVDSQGAAPIFVTDYGEKVTDPAAMGLLWALKELRRALDTNAFTVPSAADAILAQWGFIKDGRIVHDITGNMSVEKYLKGIQPEQQREQAVRYLDSTLKAEVEEITEATPVAELIAKNPKKKPEDLPAEEGEVEDEAANTTTTTTTSTPEEEAEAAKVAAEAEAAKQKKKEEREKLEKEHAEQQQEYDEWEKTRPKFTPVETIPIKPVPVNSPLNLEKILMENNIPIWQYTQVKTSAMKTTLTRVRYFFVYSAKQWYQIGLWSGSRRANIDQLQTSERLWELKLLFNATQGEMNVPPRTDNIQTVLDGKNLTLLLQDKALPLSITGFTPRKVL